MCGMWLWLTLAVWDNNYLSSCYSVVTGKKLLFQLISCCNVVSDD